MEIKCHRIPVRTHFTQISSFLHYLDLFGIIHIVTYWVWGRGLEGLTCYLLSTAICKHLNEMDGVPTFEYVNGP